MKAFTVVKGAAPYLSRANIDTDVIIRIERLTTLTRDMLGAYAMEALRFHEDGGVNTEFALNRPEFRDAPILLAGENFGCGSSREGAVWALQGIGIRCIIAPSFGDIFFSNCFQNGVLPIRLTTAQIETLAIASAGGQTMTVDLPEQKILSPSGEEILFVVDPTRRESLLKGLDDIALTLQDDTLIRQWQRADRLSRPWAWPNKEVVIS